MPTGRLNFCDHRRPRPIFAVLSLVAASMACDRSPGAGPSEPLPSRPSPVSPMSGSVVSSDRPTLTVRNANGFDAGQATYLFRITSASGARVVQELTVPAGTSTTSAVPTQPVPRGMLLAWSVTARGAAGEVASDTATFRVPVAECVRGVDPYAKLVVSWFIPQCSLDRNVYNDPEEVLGPPDAGGFGPFNYRGFVSLGEGGHVVVDMQACGFDLPGPDVRVFQAVGSEPVTVYAGGSPTGPWVLLEARKRCGERVPGLDRTIRFCDFDLASGEVQEARYFKVEDGELFPCELGETPSEGADIDAVQLLNVAGQQPGYAPPR